MNSSHKADVVLSIEQTIYLIRGKRVMLDADLAAVYGVPTKRLNEQVKRNPHRFPSDFAFRLSLGEVKKLNRSQIATGLQGGGALRSQNATSKQGRGGRRYLPHAFTEHGAIMAANVLNSIRAVRMSVYIVRAFVRLREELLSRSGMEKRLAQIEKTLVHHDAALRGLYEKIRPLLLPPPEPPKKQIGFHVREKQAVYRTSRRTKKGISHEAH